MFVRTIRAKDELEIYFSNNFTRLLPSEIVDGATLR